MNHDLPEVTIVNEGMETVFDKKEIANLAELFDNEFQAPLDFLHDSNKTRERYMNQVRSH